MTTHSHPGIGLMAVAEESGVDRGPVTRIGNTPIRRIQLLIGGQSRNVYLKLEGDNPGGSIKDRTALSLLRSLEKTGRLSEGVRLVESSSGNLAIGLAMLARDSGYRFTAVVDPKVTAENIRRLHDLGAEAAIVETPDETGGYLRSRLARIRDMLAEDPGLLWTNQYSNAANPEAHYSGTAPEIFRQMEQRVDAVFVALPADGAEGGCRLRRRLHGRHPGGHRAILPRSMSGHADHRGRRQRVGGPGRASRRPKADRHRLLSAIRVRDPRALRRTHLR